jgi:hypothetical protein
MISFSTNHNIVSENKEGNIHKEVEKYDDGKLVNKGMMKLKKIKTFTDDIVIYIF